MSYLNQLMNAEREFTKLAAVKLERSKDMTLSLFYRNKNYYDHLKAMREVRSYRREIEELADTHFPIHLEITFHELLRTPTS
ncbi:hypothetical protein V8V91_08695 [Algoriphagus halophilus]|uniref:hypothetical protein n=1 Tax=Algoriphagus halophilus TaxID=226505 RepID=UPI00358FE153